jgi:glycosyltransferase involved in cell wall biosynthesis
MPQTSVIIPLFNDAAGLHRAVSSALNQANLGEIIIVDDASTDNSLAVAQNIARTHPAITVIHSQNNFGPAAARNLGARQARFDYIGFLDSDDEFLEGYLSETVKLLEANPDVHAVKVGVEFLDPVRGNVLPDFDPRYPVVVFSAAWNVIIRRSSFIKMGGFPESEAFRTDLGGEDVAFSTAVAKYLAPLAKLDKAFYRCWSHEGTHLHRFLANTRLAQCSDGFEFVVLRDEQKHGGLLPKAIEAYLIEVAANIGVTDKDN